jgi:hypothetical protein
MQKKETRLKRFAGHKHSSLFVQRNNDKEKKSCVTFSIGSKVYSTPKAELIHTWKGFPDTNTLAYLSGEAMRKKKKFRNNFQLDLTNLICRKFDPTNVFDSKNNSFVKNVLMKFTALA